MISGHPIFIGFHRLTSCQQDPRDRGVLECCDIVGIRKQNFVITFLTKSRHCSKQMETEICHDILQLCRDIES